MVPRVDQNDQAAIDRINQSMLVRQAA